jgi:hypothetical protein
MFAFQDSITRVLLLSHPPDSFLYRLHIPADAAFEMGQQTRRRRRRRGGGGNCSKISGGGDDDVWLGFVFQPRLPNPAHDRNFASFWMSTVTNEENRRQRQQKYGEGTRILKFD